MFLKRFKAVDKGVLIKTSENLVQLSLLDSSEIIVGPHASTCFLNAKGEFTWESSLKVRDNSFWKRLKYAKEQLSKMGSELGVLETLPASFAEPALR